MNKVPDGTGLASQVYDCNEVFLTISGYIVSRGQYAIARPQIDHNTDNKLTTHDRTSTEPP